MDTSQVVCSSSSLHWLALGRGLPALSIRPTFCTALVVVMLNCIWLPTLDAVLAVWFGVNDPENADSYVTYMNNVSLQWGIPVYYLNVGPCYGSWAVKEPAVQEMNRKLAEGLREEITVIDVYSFIQNGMDTGIFGTQDGLHYNYETCRAIVDFAVREIDADLKSKGL